MRLAIVLVLVVALNAGGSWAAGQEVQPLSEPPVDVSSPQPEEGRILGVIPNNKTVSRLAPSDGRLLPRQKFSLALKDTTDPFTFVLAGFYAGMAQWQNDFAFGQGGVGYGKRFGAALADQAIGNYFTEAILPSLLREDPRYFRMGSGSKWRRIGYAMTRTVVIRTDAGRNTFNYSEIVGNAIGAGISNLYYPAANRSVEETGEKLAVQVASDSVFNILLEFWPDIRHGLLRSSRKTEHGVK